MNVVFTKPFLKTAASLPVQTQKILDDCVLIVKRDPFHPLLHTKRLAGDLRNFYSFRITRDWRVIFTFQKPDTIILIEVGHRKDIYR